MRCNGEQNRKRSGRRWRGGMALDLLDTCTKNETADNADAAADGLRTDCDRDLFAKTLLMAGCFFSRYSL